jgi:hypothetical protein
MEMVPPEILGLILDWQVRMCQYDKNLVLPQRLVCKRFDAMLQPFIFRTIQLEFSRFLKGYRDGNGRPDYKVLEGVGEKCEAVHLDLMVVRDEGWCSCFLLEH